MDRVSPTVTQRRRLRCRLRREYFSRATAAMHLESRFCYIHATTHPTPLPLHPPMSMVAQCPSPPPPFHLILASSSLASLELIQVPPTDGQVALLLIRALPEVGDVLRTDLRRLVLLVHRILAIVLLGDRLVGGRCSLGAAAEHSAERMTDAGADCDTAVEFC